MTDRFILINERVRDNASQAVANAPDGYVVTISEPKRSLDQNAYLHAVLSDLAKSDVEWAGNRRTVDEWKMLMVSGHAIATKEGAEVVAGLEGEIVPIRESTARMSKARAASLIEYIIAFCAMNNVPLTDARKGGFMEDSR